MEFVGISLLNKWHVVNPNDPDISYMHKTGPRMLLTFAVLHNSSISSIDLIRPEIFVFSLRSGSDITRSPKTTIQRKCSFVRLLGTASTSKEPFSTEKAQLLCK